MRELTKSAETAALLGAFALFLSTIEYLIPKPLPFIRLGLANLPVLISLYLLTPRYTFLLIALKVAGQGLVHGTVFSYIFLFSAAGSLTGGAVMLGMKTLGGTRVSPVGISAAGALGSNLMQLLLARLVVIGPGAMLIAPPFLAVGLISSLLLGVFAAAFVNRSRWFQRMRAEAGGGHACLTGGAGPAGWRQESGLAGGGGPAGGRRRPDRRPRSSSLKITAAQPYLEKHISSAVLIAAGLLSVPPFLLQNHLLLQAAQTALFIAAALLAGKRVRLLPPVIILVSVSVLNLISPIGRVLTSFWRFSVTSGALYLGLHKSLTLIGLIFLSRATVRPDLTLPGRFGAVVSRSFYFFDRINETWETIPKQKIIPRLDALLERIREPADAPPEQESQGPGDHGGNTAEGTTGLGFMFAGLFVAVQWTLFSLQYFIPWNLLSGL
jgi:heptaprenyl diphosphate synthase